MRLLALVCAFSTLSLVRSPISLLWVHPNIACPYPANLSFLHRIVVTSIPLSDDHASGKSITTIALLLCISRCD